MYANFEQVLLKGTLGILSHKLSTNTVSSTQSLTLIPYKFSYHKGLELSLKQVTNETLWID